MNQKILMFFIEPTPYIMALIRELNIIWPEKITVFFLKENYTQQWNISLEQNCSILSKNIFQLAYRVYKLLSCEKYQIIFVSGWGSFFNVLMFFYSYLFSIKLTVSSDTTLNPSAQWWKKITKKIVYPYLFKIPAIFFPGGTKQSFYIQHYNVPVNRIAISQMTVDVTKIKNYVDSISIEEIKSFKNAHNIDNEDFVFLYVGRLEPFKGIIEVISAFEQLIYSGVKLCIVGDGTLKPTIQEKANANKNIIYVGRKKDKQLFDMYLLSDVVILYSPFDQWGLVVNEAMAFGKPVIISDQVGCADDLVTHNTTGLIIPWGEMNLLVDSMKLIQKNSKLYALLSENSIFKIASWTMENTAKNISSAWIKLLFRNNSI